MLIFRTQISHGIRVTFSFRMNPLHWKRQAHIVINYLPKIQIRIRFRKPNNLPLTFFRIAAVSRFLTELYTQAEPCLDRKSQILKASVASHNQITYDITVNPDEMT